MDNSYELYHVTDSRLNKIASSVQMPVFSGPSSNTYNTYNVNGNASPTSIKFQVQVPNQDVAIDRRMYVEAKMTFEYKRNANGNDDNPLGANAKVFSYGQSEAFKSFPLNRMITSSQLRLNQCMFTENISENIPGILRTFDYEELAMYQNGTPVFPDNFRTYDDIGITDTVACNPFGALDKKNYSEFLYPRGCHPATITNKQTGTGVPANPNDPGYPNKKNDDNKWTFTIVAKFIEPLLMSPLLYGNPEKSNNCAFLGISTLDLQLTLANYQWCFSTSTPLSTIADYSFTLTKVEDAKLHLNFLSLPDSLKLPPRFVVPYLVNTRYKTTASLANVAGYQSMVSNNVQLNSVPERILIYVQDVEGSRTIKSSDTVLPIDSVSIKFANRSGLLSSASQYQLYKMSRDNGLFLDWYSWSGEINRGVTPINDNPATGLGTTIKTVGSYILINPSKDLSLPEPLVNGVSAALDFEVRVQVKNTTGVVQNFELVVLVSENGLMKTENGVTSTIVSPLTKDQVLNAMSSSSIDSAPQQIYGGGRDEDLRKLMKENRQVQKALHGASRSGGLRKFAY